MKSQEIRKQFINFFEKKHHKFVYSSPVVPLEDPTLLFTNAGMNQFKNIFLGLEKRDYTRVANTQKCIRVSGKHNDLEEVGRDTYHHTFFEMLGNWSFGDYYKKEAITWAWELLTDVWKLPKKQLYATVYQDDDDAAEIWKNFTDVQPEHIVRFGMKENFWEMGETGPCGPCSEIHIDLGPERCDKKDIPHKCQVNGECGRYIELWNLVFIQYNREHDQSLVELPAKHVDTGMGFERIVSVIQNVNSNYSTDLFVPIINKINELTGIKFPGTDKGVAHRVIADHIRALAFAITDGGLPSNEGRGYVLRRILRRAARFGRTLNVREPFIYKIVPTVVEVMGDAFPELKEKHHFASMVIKAEEEGFNNTLDRGIEIFEKLALQVIQQKKTEVPGDEAFKLYDTYGFPLDLTQLMAREKGLTVDMDGFNVEMESQRKRAREAGKWEYDLEKEMEGWIRISSGSDSEFVGYERLMIDSEIREIKQLDGRILLTLSKTPFYAESGGQIGDVGEISGKNFKLEIKDTKKIGNKIVHIGEGVLAPADITPEVKAIVKTPVRLATARNHTTTHLVQAALREVLGKHVHQSGSLVTSERFRFDLTHFERIPSEDLQKIENRVNEKIRENLRVEKLNMDFDSAQKMGAMALFGEKYGDQVRVIRIADYSLELCGGTHLEYTGQIGSFRILAEMSVAAGIRRIEGVTGELALEMTQKEHCLLETLREKFNASIDDLPERIDELIKERKNLEKQLQEFRGLQADQQVLQLVNKAVTLDNMRIVTSLVEMENVETLRNLAEKLRDTLKSGIGVLGCMIDEKINFICVVTDDLIKNKKLNAGQIVKEVARITGGSGGGRPHMALAGGKDVNRLEEALNSVLSIVKSMLN
jgi:alanyl-tRNA synthetase